MKCGRSDTTTARADPAPKLALGRQSIRLRAAGLVFSHAHSRQAKPAVRTELQRSRTWSSLADVLKMKRVFAGSMVALMLSVSAFAASCDLSCGFASSRSDCHTQNTQVQPSVTADVNMDMPMAGMQMPGMPATGTRNQTASQISVFEMSREIPHHASFVDIGACERQSCSEDQAVAARVNPSTMSHCDVTWAVAHSCYVDRFPATFHDGGDDISQGVRESHSPPVLTLRI